MTKRAKLVVTTIITCILLVLALRGNHASSAARQATVPSTTYPTQQHPVSQLINTGQREFDELQRKQSKSLKQAVKEYRRRYGMHPPPHFDKWYEFATHHGVVFIDEFDTIYQSILPFWGLTPKGVRKRSAEALQNGRDLMQFTIRHGQVTDIEGGPGWFQDAVKSMMHRFVEYLPNMEIAFNTIDEPRVVVPHTDLERLVKAALTKNIPAHNANRRPINSFSPQPVRLVWDSDPHTANASFTQLAHEPSWPHLRLACPPDSPARALENHGLNDDVGSYGKGYLGFIYNTSAMSDICLSPSLSISHGFFDKPDSHSLSYDLVPIFSQSKVSSNGDLLYPSPWYWVDMVKYDAASDMPWAEKKNKLYWRGSTTGGFGIGGNWKTHHRQRFVDMMSGNSSAFILSPRNKTKRGWQVDNARRDDYRDLVDLSFTRVVQCEEADCNSQEVHFNIQGPASQQDGWSSKFLLDMDGNAFSGRFHTFLRSSSATFKFAVFREWHSEWLKPWVHYVPLSLQGKEWLELLRYFSNGAVEDAQASDIASQSSIWADKSLRKEDMEAWFFRLLLE